MKIKKTILCGILLSILFLGLTLRKNEVFAESTGNIKLVVKDQSGRAVPKVKVKWKDTKVNVTREVTTGTDGTYLFTGMSAGRDYEMSVVSAPNGYSFSSTPIKQYFGVSNGQTAEFRNLRVSENVGNINLVVKDQLNRSVPGVKVRWRDTKVNVTREVTTGIDGTYLFTGMSAGRDYEMSVVSAPNGYSFSSDKIKQYLGVNNGRTAEFGNLRVTGKNDNLFKTSYEKLIAEAQAQEQNQDHDVPKTKSLWKIKWVGFSNVTFIRSNGTKETKMMDSNEKKFVSTVAEEFKKTLEQLNPHVVYDIDVTIYDTPMFINEDDGLMHLDSYKDQNATILKELASEGKYDTFVSIVHGRNGGGVTSPKYYLDSIGTGYFSFGLTHSNAENYPNPNNGDKISLATGIALHEFCHQMSYQNVLRNYPLVHGDRDIYGYPEEKISNGGFYRDYLTGNVTNYKKNNGKKIGIYPQAWRISPTTMRNFK